MYSQKQYAFNIDGKGTLFFKKYLSLGKSFDV